VNQRNSHGLRRLPFHHARIFRDLTLDCPNDQVSYAGTAQGRNRLCPPEESIWRVNRDAHISSIAYLAQ